jgi:hypothetical protein
MYRVKLTLVVGKPKAAEEEEIQEFGSLKRLTKPW